MIEYFNFDLRPIPAAQPPTHPGFSCQEMCDDKRKAHELAEEFIGKKVLGRALKDTKLSLVESKAYLNAYIHVIVARSNHNSKSILHL